MSPETVPLAAATRTRLHALRCVGVGSTNAPKLAAVRAAFEAYAPGVQVQGVAVESGVAEQPVGLEEIVRGARARAQAALRATGGELGVGVEDGLVELGVPDAEVVNLGCAAVTDGRATSLGFSAAFAYPPACTRPAFERREPIGALFDRFWREHRPDTDEGPSGAGVGNIGKLSLGVLPRAEYARHAVLCALLRFLHPDLYGSEAATP